MSAPENIEILAQHIERLTVVMDRAAHPRPAQAVSLPVAAGTQQILAGGGVLLGWSILNTDGAVANAVQLIDGNDAGGQTVAVLNLPVGGSSALSLAPAGIELARGLVIAQGSTLAGVVYVLPHRKHD